MKNGREIALIIVLVVVTFVPRLYRLSYPIADWHSFRQVDTASVTREYIQHGVDILRPRYQDLSNIQSGLHNLEGWRMVEFPFVNAFIATLIRAVPSLDIASTSRIVSIIFSIGTTLSLYFLVKRISGQQVAFMSGFVFALLPYSVFYGRTILPEPAMLFFSTASLLFFNHYVTSKKIPQKVFFYFLSLITLSLALLLKPFVAFLGPVYIAIALLTYRKNIFKHLELILFVLVAFLPLYLWREWIKNFPSGIPASTWLFNENGIRLRPAWFRWLFYERLTKLILGWWGWIFVGANFVGILQLVTRKRSSDSFSAFLKESYKRLVQNQKLLKEIVTYGSWIFGILIYLVVIATGNVQHDYYQVFTLPIVAILVGRGMNEIITIFEKKRRFSYGFVTVLFIMMLAFSWQKTKGYFNVNHWEYIKAGEMIDKLIPADAKVIAPAFGDTVFLYQTNRTGWPIGFEIEDKIARGAEYYVSTAYDDEARRLEKEYTPIFKDETFIIIKLVAPETKN